jgi:hypothetical protein
MNTFQGLCYLYPTPSHGRCPIFVASIGPDHWAVVVQYPTATRILHSPNLPSCTSPDLAQRALTKFATARNLEPLDRLPPSLLPGQPSVLPSSVLPS